MTWWEMFLAGFTAGLAALTLLALVIIAYWTRRITRGVRHVQEKWTAKRFGLNGEGPLPLRIQWRADHAGPEQRALLAAIGQILEPLGFVAAGTYSESESGMLLRGWVNTDQSVIAAAYLFPLGSPWLELVCTYTDGSAFVCSNAEFAELEYPPNQEHRFFPGVPPRELWAKFLELRREGPLNAVASHSLTATLEQLHTTTTDWRAPSDGSTSPNDQRQQ